VKTRRTIRPYWASPGENVHLPVNFYSTLGKSYDRKFFAQEVLGQYLSVFWDRCTTPMILRKTLPSETPASRRRPGGNCRSDVVQRGQRNREPATHRYVRPMVGKHPDIYGPSGDSRMIHQQAAVLRRI
jgi:hypothetical protein